MTHRRQSTSRHFGQDFGRNHRPAIPPEGALSGDSAGTAIRTLGSATTFRTLGGATEPVSHPERCDLKRFAPWEVRCNECLVLDSNQEPSD